jgi:hypothetical protein
MKSIANKNVAADSPLDVLELRMAASCHSGTLAGKMINLWARVHERPAYSAAKARQSYGQVSASE